MTQNLKSIPLFSIVEIEDPLFPKSLWVCKDQWDDFYLSNDKANATPLCDREIEAFLKINPSYEVEPQGSLSEHALSDRVVLSGAPAVLIAAEQLSAPDGWAYVEGGTVAQ